MTLIRYEQWYNIKILYSYFVISPVKYNGLIKTLQRSFCIILEIFPSTKFWSEEAIVVLSLMAKVIFMKWTVLLLTRFSLRITELFLSNNNSWHFSRTYFMPGTITRVLHVSTHLHLVRTLWGRCYYHSLSYS